MSRSMIYFKDGELVASHNSARVYKFNDCLFLEIGDGHTLWALESELLDYIDQLKDYPKGDCLEIGLGLGVASRYILSFPEVTSLTTVDINSDVIGIQKEIKDDDRNYIKIYNKNKHTILNADGLLYACQTKKKYDFVFIDCYDRIDEDTLPYIKDLAIACRRLLRPEGIIIGWLDKYTPNPYYKEFVDLFERLNR